MTFKAFLPFACLLLTACAQRPVATVTPAPIAPAPVATTVKPTPTQATSPRNDKALNDILVAEVAAQQGDLNTALDIYVKQSKATDDAKLAQQAARLALYMGKAQTALDMTDIWLKQQPDNLEALQIRTFAHVYMGQPEAAQQDINRQLAISPDQALPALLSNSKGLTPTQMNTLLAALAGLTDQYPKQASLWFAKALMDQQNKQYESAIDACDHALKLNPKHLESQLLKANLLVQLGKPDKALKLLTKLEKKQPDKPQVAIARIRLLLQQKQIPAAGNAIEAFTQRFPDDQDMQMALALFALQQGDSQHAIPVLQSLQTQKYQPDDTAFYLAQAYAMQHDWQPAIDTYLTVKGKRQLQASAEAARLMYQQNQTQAASDLFTQLRKNNPDQAATLYGVEVSLLIEQHQSALVRPLLQQALASFPKDTDLLYLRAMTEDKEHNYPAMEQDLNAIIAIDPNNVNALNALGYTLSNHSERYQEAWYYIKRAHARDPNNPAIQDSLGWVLYRLKRFDEALPLLQKAYDAMPDPEVAGHLVITLRAMGDDTHANKFLKQALEKFPGNADLTALGSPHSGKS